VNARLFAMPGAGPFARSVAANVPLERGELTPRRFPDGETYVRVESDVTRRDCVVVADLARPDEKVVPLLLVAATLRDLGARRVGLVAPYLPYLRQDARFAAGEGITSVYFARWISGAFDWLCTVDPHLHRHPTLAAVYSIPAEVVAAAPRIAAWIRREVAAPLLVGPDEESTQWVAQVAASAGAPFVVAAKRRHGDRDVEIDLPDLAAHRGRTPVLVDDIASTARTMVAVARQLTERAVFRRSASPSTACSPEPRSTSCARPASPASRAATRSTTRRTRSTSRPTSPRRSNDGAEGAISSTT